MKSEYKVGLLFLTTVILVVVFAYILGIVNPFSNTYELNVMYNYAGGIEEGSPVRVMGIKVGKVKKIEFKPEMKAANGEEVKLSVVIQVEKKVWKTIRKDSRFFINLAGVIGEKFLEISPGSIDEAEFSSGDSVRGEDPPRVDQLISQSYGLAGRLLEIVNKNEGSVSNMISQLDRLVTNFNKTLSLLDKTSKNAEMTRLLNNMIQISDDLAYLTKSLRGKNAEEAYETALRILRRADKVDGPLLKKFLQEEGVKARVF